MAKYRVYVKPEGHEYYQYAGIKSFKSDKEAITWSGIESIAGMGETYKVKKVKPRKWKH